MQEYISSGLPARRISLRFLAVRSLICGDDGMGLARNPEHLGKSWLQLVSMFALWVGLSSSGLSQEIAYGMNYNVTSTDSTLVANCATDPNATVFQKAFMPRYASPALRQTVQEQLKEMQSSGFEAVRSLIQLYPGDHPSGDLTNAENVDGKVLDSLKNYVQDVHDAGFKQLVLAFGTQGRASAGCRKREWGDCFDPATVTATVNAEALIVRAAQSVTGILLRVDLLNEACVSDVVPPLLNANFATFIRAAAKTHAANFPTVPVTVSCQIERTGNGLATTSRLFVESGDRIGFFDIHAYPGATDRESEVLAQAASGLRGNNIPILIGETMYGDHRYQRQLVTNFRAAFHRDPDGMLFWPVHSMASHCNFEVPLPYRLKDALGK